MEYITKPTLIIDEVKTKSNIQRMVNKAEFNGIRLRPHFKTHQSHEVGGWFRDAGVKSITVSSLDMAAYFAEDAWQDILVAFPVNLLEIQTILDLSKKVKLGLLVDSAYQIEELSKALTSQVDIWLKIDVGTHRAGVHWQDEQTILKLMENILAEKQLNFCGILAHAGHTYNAKNNAHIKDIYQETRARLTKIRQSIEAAFSVSCLISVGDTPACSVVEDLSGVDEIRPGNFTFYDVQQMSLGVCGLGDISISLACPVISVYPDRNEALIYGGAIHLSKDQAVLPDGSKHFGLVRLSEDDTDEKIQQRYLRSVSQEHGIIKLLSDDSETLKPTQIIWVYPAHSCLTLQAMGVLKTAAGRTIETMLKRVRPI